MIQIAWFVLYVWGQWELRALASKNLRSRNSTGDLQIGLHLSEHVDTANWNFCASFKLKKNRNWLICCIWFVAVRIARSQKHQQNVAQFCRYKLIPPLTWRAFQQCKITAALQVSSYIVTYWLICALWSVAAVRNFIHTCHHQQYAPRFCMYKPSRHPSLRSSR